MPDKYRKRLSYMPARSPFLTQIIVQSKPPLVAGFFLPTRLTHAHTQPQTLENRSSSAPPNPPAGLEAGLLLFDGPVLLAHPPNSSSAETLGCGLKPPPEPGTIGVLANDPPEAPQPKSFDEEVAAGGLLGAGSAAGAAGATGAAGPGAAQAFPPHTSAPEIPDVAKAGAAVVFGGDCWGAEFV